MLKISVVEDLPDIRKSLVRRINTAEGMICISNYSSGEEALENLPKDLPDLVLMDIGLPKMTGIECMVRISFLKLKMDFLMFTVFEEDEQVFEALKAGAVGYILKSKGFRNIINDILEYKNGGSPMSSTIARKVLTSFSQKKKALSTEFEHLTKQQTIILEQLAQGLLNKEIGDRLNISEKTVKQHNNAIYKKLQVNNRTEAVRKYLDNINRG